MKNFKKSEEKIGWSIDDLLENPKQLESFLFSFLHGTEYPHTAARRFLQQFGFKAKQIDSMISRAKHEMRKDKIVEFKRPNR